MLDIVARAFQDGCNVSLEEAICSKRYEELRAKQDTLFERYAENTDEGIALRAGHFVMGRLFNTLPEQEAIEQARELMTAQSRGIEHRAFIQLLGEYIVAEATKCLPQEAIALAEEWKQADAERQIQLARDVHILFGSEDQRVEREMNWQSLWREVDEDIRHNYSHSDSGAEYLPHLYGKWDKETCPANCLGKTQMLVAFGRLVNTPVLVVSPIVSAKNVIEEWRKEACQKLRDDIMSRGIYPDEQMWESMEASEYLDLLKRFRWQNFHNGTALQLKDGRWVLIDPHGLDWGVFPDVWEVDRIWQMFCKYQEVLPGLSLIDHDHDTLEALRLGEMQRVEELLKRSRAMEAKLGDSPSIDEVIRVFAQSEDLELIAEELAGFPREMPLEDPAMREYVAIAMIIGEEFPSLGTMFQLATDKELAKKKIGSLLTAYHCIAMEGLKDQRLNESGRVLHPVCEFSLPEYDIAMSVINSLSCDDARISQEFFLDYNFNQLTLCNALTEIFPKDNREQKPELARAAAQVVGVLPFVHSRCNTILKMYSHRF